MPPKAENGDPPPIMSSFSSNMLAPRIPPRPPKPPAERNVLQKNLFINDAPLGKHEIGETHSNTFIGSDGENPPLPPGMPDVNEKVVPPPPGKPEKPANGLAPAPAPGGGPPPLSPSSPN